jgi:teichuronic acid exporter
VSRATTSALRWLAPAQFFAADAGRKNIAAEAGLMHDARRARPPREVMTPIAEVPGDTSPEVAANPPPVEAKAPLAVRAVGSTVWNMINQVFQIVLGLVSFAFLSRWLTPTDYGLLGMAATVSSVIGIIGDVGVSSNIIRVRDLDEAAESTAFWLGILGAVGLALITAISAPIVARFYRNDSVMILTLSLAATFLLAAPGRVPNAKLARDLRFRTSTIIAFVSNLGATVLVIIMAYRGFGPWALICQTGATFAIQSVLSWIVCPPRFRLSAFSRERARQFAKFGSQVSGYGLATTVARALDNVLAGRLLGSVAVGFMSMGMKLVYYPADRLCGGIYWVFLPTSAEIDNVPQLSRAFQSATRLLFIIIGPFACGAAAVAPEFVTLLPSKWLGLAPVLAAYALTTLALPLNYLSLAVLVTIGRADVMLRTAVALIPVCWLGAFVGSMSGSVLIMVYAWSFAICLSAASVFRFVWRHLQFTRNFWSILFAPLAASLGMAVGIRVVLHLTGLAGHRSGFAVGVIVGALLYVALGWAPLHGDMFRAVGLLRQAVARRRASAQ